MQGQGLGSQIELVALRAPEEVEAADALLDRAADEPDDEDDPRRSSAPGRVEGRVVEVEDPRVDEREGGGDPDAVHVEEVQGQPPERLEGPGDAGKETRPLRPHEPALLPLAPPVQLEEALEVRLQRLGPRGGYLRAGRRLVEPAQLAPELVAAAVAELLQIVIEGVGERQ